MNCTGRSRERVEGPAAAGVPHSRLEDRHRSNFRSLSHPSSGASGEPSGASPAAPCPVSARRKWGDGAFGYAASNPSNPKATCSQSGLRALRVAAARPERPAGQESYEPPRARRWSSKRASSDCISGTSAHRIPKFVSSSPPTRGASTTRTAPSSRRPQWATVIMVADAEGRDEGVAIDSVARFQLNRTRTVGRDRPRAKPCRRPVRVAVFLTWPS